MRTSWLRFVVAVRVAGAAAPDWLPASLRQLEPVALPGAWDALLAFFAPGGASERYRIALDPSARAAASAARAAAGETTPASPPRAQCVDGDLRPGSWSSSGLAWDDRAAPWWNPEAFVLTHGKWSTEVWLPLALALSRAGKECELPNFSLGRFPLVLADFWTSDHLSERSRSVDAFSGSRARGTPKLERR